LLDEPNSNLDADGERAVSSAIKSVRDRGGIVIVIAHRPSALEQVDMVGIIQDGALVKYGPKAEIMKVAPTPVQRTQPAAGATAAAAQERAVS
jgi:ATP-binding cassette subfamily C protein